MCCYRLLSEIIIATRLPIVDFNSNVRKQIEHEEEEEQKRKNENGPFPLRRFELLSSATFSTPVPAFSTPAFCAPLSEPANGTCEG